MDMIHFLRCTVSLFQIGSGEGHLIMEDRDLEYFRGVLTQSLKDLVRKGGEAVSSLLETPVEASDPMDKATLEADRNFNIRMRDRETKLIHKIELSLARIDDGTFGICEECGEEISIKRLKARPVTTYCIACKNRLETIEKGAGN